MTLRRSTRSVLRRSGRSLGFKEVLTGIREGVWKSLLHLTFPAKCLHCHTLIPPSSSVLCSSCSSLLELSHPEGRCPLCYNLKEEDSPYPCSECTHYPSPYLRMASAFDYQGPAASLVRRLKYSQQPYLARGMAAFLIAQLDCLEWPIPDAIVPVPQSLTRWLERGYNQSQLLADEMGSFLDRPAWNLLKRQSGDYSQAALNLEQREKLDGSRFSCKTFHNLQGKVLLVVDDVMTSGLTLQRCGEVLQREKPSALYALTFCRT